MGGYFICNGLERLIRLLVVPRRNYPMAVERPAFTNRGAQFTPYGVMMRAVNESSQTGRTLTMHYLQDGQCVLRFGHLKREFFLPVVVTLRALVEITDRELYETVVDRPGDDSLESMERAGSVARRFERMLRAGAAEATVRGRQM